MSSRYDSGEWESIPTPIGTLYVLKMKDMINAADAPEVITDEHLIRMIAECLDIDHSRDGRLGMTITIIAKIRELQRTYESLISAASHAENAPNDQFHRENKASHDTDTPPHRPA